MDEAFLEGLRQTFQHRRLEIVVREADETEYLLGPPANRKALLSALEDLEAGRNIVVPDQSAFEPKIHESARACDSCGRMKIKLDENLPESLVAALSAFGHAVSSL